MSQVALSPDAPLLLKKANVCERLGLSSRTLENLVKAGDFPPPVRMGKYVYWTDKVLEKWITRMFGPQEAWRP